MRHSRTCIILATTLLLSGICTVSRAAPPDRLLQGRRFVQQLPTQPHVNHQANGAVMNSPPDSLVKSNVHRPRFWVVSASGNPQTGIPQFPCRLEYLRPDADGQFRRANRQSFLNWLDPQAPICLVVHGSFVRMDSVFREGFELVRWVNSANPTRPVNVVLFRWPSDGPLMMVPHIDVAVLGRRAAFNGFYLAQLINRLPTAQPICLVGHSHGARMVASTLHLLGGGSVQGYGVPPNMARTQRLRAVLFAAAMDHHWFNPGERYGQALYRTEGLLNLRNRDDIALRIYRLRKAFSEDALARTGFTNRDIAMLGSLNDKISEVDVTVVVRTGHMWHHYYLRQGIATIMAPYVSFIDDRSRMPQTVQNTPAQAAIKHTTATPTLPLIRVKP